MKTKLKELNIYILFTLFLFTSLSPYVVRTLLDYSIDSKNYIEITTDNLENLDSLYSDNSYCYLSTDDIDDIISDSDLNSKYQIGYKEISLYPEIENLFCLGRVVGTTLDSDTKLSDTNDFFVSVGTSTNFYNLLMASGFVALVLFSLFAHRKLLGPALISPMLYLNSLNYLFNSKNGIADEIIFATAVIFSIFIFRYKVFSNMLDIKINRINYRKDINGLRAIAVLSVVLYHIDFPFITAGYLGVDMFYVISGFLISNIIFAELNSGTFTFRNFYERRVRRIIPALLSTILITIPFSYILFTTKPMLEYLKSIPAALFFVANYFFNSLDFYTAEPSKYMPLLHTWSLAIEEQFYILFPFLCFVAWNKFKNNYVNLIISIGIISISLNILSNNNGAEFYLIQFRAWELLLGVLIMIFSQTTSIKIKNFKTLGMVILLIPIFIFTDSNINMLFPKLMCLLGISLVLVDDRPFVFDKILKTKLIYYIGISSYSVYLLHQPFFAFIRYQKQLNNFYNQSQNKLFLVIALLVFSFFHWKLIEKPFQNNFTKLKQSLLILLGIFILSFVYLGIASEGFKNRFSETLPDKVYEYSNYTNLYPVQNDVQENMIYDCSFFPMQNFDKNKNILNYQSDTGPCSFVFENSQNRFFLIGDSHANTLSVSLIKEIPSKYSFVPFNGTIGRCLLTAQTDASEVLYACSREFFNTLLNQLDSEKDIVVLTGRFDLWVSDIGQGHFQLESENYIQEMIYRIEHLAKNSKKLVIIYPVPNYDFNIAEMYIRGITDWNDVISQDYDTWTTKAKMSYDTLDSISGQNINRLLAEEIFCNTFVEDKCIAAFEENLFYTDDNHLSIEGTSLLAERILSVLERE
jgi:peptidoglycan/LPS O-acetylase OafA/YrhL